MSRRWLLQIVMFAAFSGADNLWSSIQHEATDYIESNQGNAFTAEERIARPYWIELRKFLKGQITLQQYKAQNNCP
jgi:hypothetical protein